MPRWESSQKRPLRKGIDDNPISRPISAPSAPRSASSGRSSKVILEPIAKKASVASIKLEDSDLDSDYDAAMQSSLSITKISANRSSHQSLSSSTFSSSQSLRSLKKGTKSPNKKPIVGILKKKNDDENELNVSYEPTSDQEEIAPESSFGSKTSKKSLTNSERNLHHVLPIDCI